MPTGDEVLNALQELEVPSPPEDIAKYLKSHGYSRMSFKKLLLEVKEACEIGAMHGFIEECRGQYFSIKQTAELLDCFDTQMMLQDTAGVQEKSPHSSDITINSISEIPAFSKAAAIRKKHAATKPSVDQLFDSSTEMYSFVDPTPSVISVPKRVRRKVKKKPKNKARKRRKTVQVEPSVTTGSIELADDDVAVSDESIPLSEPYVMPAETKRRYLNIIKSLKSKSTQLRLKKALFGSTDNESEVDYIPVVTERKAKPKTKRNKKKRGKKIHSFKYKSVGHKAPLNKKRNLKPKKSTRNYNPNTESESQCECKSDVNSPVAVRKTKTYSLKSVKSVPARKITRVASKLIAKQPSADNFEEPCTSSAIAQTTIGESESKLKMVLRSGREY
ncbi:uncharacterized protein LOC119685743 [Teleopsis dalmanni]|uniref:uncharacterized protein LOC119685743 n=1 Tax=Teleopsis dalmanni TaxID=139649 RepID=UPI000D32AEC4|nr:uncharacterized protein LOC119685743 [Teleopsis dalmanni]XP_037956043.1 uncharacterized protein LOC119685743 [Teleopsis dalmanni]